jgi:outer membrane autotransporter protein
VGAAGNSDPNATPALAQITVNQSRQPVDASQTAVRTQAFNLGSRLAALRGGAVGLNIRGLTLNMGDQAISGAELARLVRGADRERAGGAASADSGFSRWGAFVNGTINNGDKDVTANEAGFDFDTWGLTAGVDYRFTDTLVFGGAFNYVNSNNDLKNKGGNLDTTGYGLALYGTYYQSDQFYLDGILAYGKNDYDQSRNIVYSLPSVAGTPSAQVGQVLTADYNGNQFTASLSGGYDFNRGAWTFAPIGGLQYINADVDGYRERARFPGQPGAGWVVQIRDQDFTSFTSNLGGKVSYAWSQPWGVLVPQATVEWVHEFKDDSPFVGGSFIGSPANSFRLPTDKPDQNYFNIGVGASAVFAEGRSAYLYYQSVQGYDNLTSNSLNLGVRFEF